MQITRRYTVEGSDPFAAFTFVPRTSRIANPDGSVVFEMKDLLAPDGWSQVAVDILAQKYFRRAGVPLKTERVPEPTVPEWLQRNKPADANGDTTHHSPRDGRPPGLPPSRRLLDLLGLEGRLLHQRRRRAGVLR